MSAISTEIIFTEKQDISAVEIFIGKNKFIVTGIEESKPLNYYISSERLKEYLKKYEDVKEGESVKITDNVKLEKIKSKKWRQGKEINDQYT